MPDSHDVNVHQRKGKSNSRLEFSDTTRKHLAAAAGHKCAIHGCLAPSTCIATKKDGVVGSANFGRASHIYAAAPNGPRPAPPSMKPEEITHHSNGIWTCSSCGDIVDRLECDYSPAQLLEMKKVRESAEKMAASDPEIRTISRYISPIQFDEVFWKNLPDLKEDAIRPALLQIAAKEIERLYPPPSRDIQTPSHLPLKPLVSALSVINDGNGDDPIAVLISDVAPPIPHNRPVGDDHAMIHRMAAEIVDAWADSIPVSLEWNRSGGHRHRVNVLITAQHPQTRAVCESLIRVVGDGYGRHVHAADEGEILHLKVSSDCTLVNNLLWKLEVAFEKGEIRTTSFLRLGGRLSYSFSNSFQWEEGLDAYEQVVRKLAEGWQPIGFVEMNLYQPRIDDRMYSEAFEIKLQITASELDECLYRLSKIRLARALEAQWGSVFACTEDYFERSLDPEMIQTASDELRRSLGPPPYSYRGESPPLVSVGKRDIKLVARNGFITFQSVPRCC